MTRNPAVSVIILTYNQEATVGRALDSVIGQRCDFQFEIVVSDDCSADGTRKIVSEYAGRYPEIVRLLPKAERRGLVDNYFYALSQCRGAMIADCAGDDYWLGADSLKKKYDLLNENPTAVFVHSDWVRVADGGRDQMPSDPNGEMAAMRRNYDDGMDLLAPALGALSVPAVHLSTVLYRNPFAGMKQIPDIVANKDFGCEDLPLIAYMLSLGRPVVWLPERTLAYSVGHASVSAPVDPAKESRFYMRSVAMISDLASHYGVPFGAVSESIFSRSHYGIVKAIQSGDMALVNEFRSMLADKKIRRPLKDRLKEYLWRLRQSM